MVFVLCMLFYAQVLLWENDVSRYLEDDDNELAFSVRLAAFELLQVNTQSL